MDDDLYYAMDSSNDGSIELQIAGDNKARTQKQATIDNDSNNAHHGTRPRGPSIVDKYDEGVRCWNKLLSYNPKSDEPYKVRVSMLMLLFTIIFTSLLIWNIEDENMALSDPILWLLLAFSFIFSTIWSVLSRRIHCRCDDMAGNNRNNTIENNVENKRCCCFRGICDCINECSAAPFWAILGLLLSMTTFICSILGFIDYFYNETITVRENIFSDKINLSLTNRSFGECIILSIISMICLVISTFGFRHYCPCCKYIIKLWGVLSLYITIFFCVWDIISDVLAAVKVYVNNDAKFFWLSISFAIITFSMYQCIACTRGKRLKTLPKYMRWMLFVPVLSMIPTMVTIHWSSMIALAFSSFPQYIIALSFILEHDIISTFNVLALVMSLTQLLTSPIIATIVWLYKSSDAKELGKKISETASFGIVALFFYLVILFPVILLEIIHFCPILFEYYVYQGIDYDDLVTQLVYFNVPKLLFLIVPILIVCMTYCWHECCNGETKERNINVKSVFTSIAMGLMGLIVFSLCFLVLPLIPWSLFLVLLSVAFVPSEKTNAKMDQNQVSDNKSHLLLSNDNEVLEDEFSYYGLSCMLRVVWITLLIYILLAYGSMARMLWTVEGGVGAITYAMLMTTWGLSVYILLMPGFLSFVFYGRSGFCFLVQSCFCNCCFPCNHWTETKQMTKKLIFN